jgi:REP element-mobilizing transposase RayT
MSLISEPEFNPCLDVNSLIRLAGENLPHWQCDRGVYHISFRLADSIPKSTREQWIREREFWVAQAKQFGTEFLEETERKLQYLFSEKIEKYLDAGYGQCYLKQFVIAKLVADSLTHFDGRRYCLHAWCIMPNHVHIIAEPMPGHDLLSIIHSWKSYTAHQANKVLGLSGAFWQPDAYNHIIRSKKEYDFQVEYVWENPEKIGFVEWQWRWKR